MVMKYARANDSTGRTPILADVANRHSKIMIFRPF